MQKKDLAELREKYSEAVKNKETYFPFEKESKEKVTNSNKRNWRNIHHDFSPELVQYYFFTNYFPLFK